MGGYFSNDQTFRNSHFQKAQCGGTIAMGDVSELKIQHIWVSVMYTDGIETKSLCVHRYMSPAWYISEHKSI